MSKLGMYTGAFFAETVQCGIPYQVRFEVREGELRVSIESTGGVLLWGRRLALEDVAELLAPAALGRSHARDAARCFSLYGIGAEFVPTPGKH